MRIPARGPVTEASGVMAPMVGLAGGRASIATSVR
jgi:hypothetical protein